MENFLNILLALLMQGFPDPQPFPDFNEDLWATFVLVGMVRSAEELCETEYDLKPTGYLAGYMLKYNEDNHSLDRELIEDAVMEARDAGSLLAIDHIQTDEDCAVFQYFINGTNERYKATLTELGLWED